MGDSYGIIYFLYSAAAICRLTSRMERHIFKNGIDERKRRLRLRHILYYKPLKAAPTGHAAADRRQVHCQNEKKDVNSYNLLTPYMLYSIIDLPAYKK